MRAVLKVFLGTLLGLLLLIVLLIGGCEVKQLRYQRQMEEAFSRLPPYPGSRQLATEYVDLLEESDKIKIHLTVPEGTSARDIEEFYDSIFPQPEWSKSSSTYIRSIPGPKREVLSYFIGGTSLTVYYSQGR